MTPQTPRRGGTRLLAGSLALAAVVSLGLAACGDSSSSASAEPTPTSSAATTATTSPTTGGVLDITAADYSFSMPSMAPVAAGLVTVKLHNAGKEDHQVQLARLHDGVTMDQLAAALKQPDPTAALGLVDLAGGSNAIVPGGFQQTEVTLKAGHYVMLCFVASADGVPHLAKGMVMPFEVTGDATGASAPSTVGTVQLKEYSVLLPAGFGKGRYEVTNVGKEPHELTIVRLADGKTMNDVMAAFQPGFKGAPPVTSEGGVGALSPGGTAYGDFDLAPGNYIALCFVPGPTGVPHAAMGMMQPFTVA